MKRLSLYLFLIFFTLQTPSWADDIRDFQIEGISIGDSLLDYMTEEKINTFERNYYPKSKKYYRLYGVKKDNELTIFDRLDVSVKENDKKYIIVSVNGIIDYENNIHECYTKKKVIVSEISSTLDKLKQESYIYNYPNDKSKSDVTDFNYSNGSIRIWCTDYSEKREKDDWLDHLSLAASSMKFLNWLDTAR